MGMADCKACGGWFSSTAPSELCPTCERALKRLSGYAVPVVRCKDCKHFTEGMAVGTCKRIADKPVLPIVYDHFCSYGERGPTDGV